MVKHIILWQLKDELTTEQKAEVKAGIKAGLEGLKGKIEGLTDVHVNIDCLPSSRCRSIEELCSTPGTCKGC